MYSAMQQSAFLHKRNALFIYKINKTIIANIVGSHYFSGHLKLLIT